MNRKDVFILILVYLFGIVWIVLNKCLNLSITLCPTKILWGIPCPGCGITRAIKLCFEGNLWAAVLMNPNIILVWIILPIAPFILIIQLTTRKDYIARINAFLDKKIYLFIILITEGSIWIYNIVRHI